MKRKTRLAWQIGAGVIGAGALAALFTSSYYDPYNVCIRGATEDGMTMIVASRYCNQQLDLAGTQ